MNNLSYIMNDFMNWSMQGYTIALGFFVWPIIFSAIIGYIYVKNVSAVSASVAIIIIFASFATTGWIAGVPVIVMFLQLVVAFALTGLVIYFIIRRRG
jgi:VIT1/CCC1 family predicted Fe2+/Mn2+ transporter